MNKHTKESMFFRLIPRITFYFIFFFQVSFATFAQTSTGTGSSGQGSAPAASSAGPSTGTATVGSTDGSTNKGKGSATVSTKRGENGELFQPLKGSALDSLKNVQATEDAQKTRDLALLRKKIFGTHIFNNPNISFAPNENLATPRDYTIGPGDELMVYVYGYSQMRYTLLVNSDGFVFLEKSVAGAVQLSGRTIEQAQKELVQRLSPHFLNLGMPGSGASTFLQLTLGRTRTIRVQVLGEVVAPGTYNISSLSTALNALYNAGGPNEIGTFRDVKVVRRNTVMANIDLYELILKGALTNDIRLQDNDVVQVSPFRKRIDLQGNFKRIGFYELLPTEKLSKAIEFSGGFTENAYTARMKVLGVTPKEKKITDIVADQYDKYIPNNGDAINAEDILARFENMVNIGGAIYRPGAFSLDQNKTLLQLIKNADGLKGDAFIGRINVIRTREDLSVDNITINLADVINKKADDLELQREDQIYIPSKFELREGASITVEGEVNKGPLFTIPYSSNLTLEDAIVQSGGFRESAATTQVEVVRRKRDVDVQSVGAQIADVKLYNVNRDLTLDANDSRLILEPFDRIIVRTATNYQPQTFITIEGEIVNPGAYGLKTKDERLSDMVKRAGGLTAQAYLNGATLIRKVRLSVAEINQRQRAVNELADDSKKGFFQAETIVNDKPEAIGINFAKIMNSPGGDEDIILQDGDVIRIPKRLETIRLQGEVLMPTTVKYRGGRFMDYISQAGGFTATSLKRKSYVIYPNGSIDRTRKFLFVNIYPKIEPGSEIIVPVRVGSDLLSAQRNVQVLTGITQGVSAFLLALLALKNIN
jgi:protein involved in polysaccharide export with SLBB domain